MMVFGPHSKAPVSLAAVHSDWPRQESGYDESTTSQFEYHIRFGMGVIAHGLFCVLYPPCCSVTPNTKASIFQFSRLFAQSGGA